MTRDEIIRGLRACSHQQPECRDKCPLWMSDCKDGNLVNLDCMGRLMAEAAALLEGLPEEAAANE